MNTTLEYLLPSKPTNAITEAALAIFIAEPLPAPEVLSELYQSKWNDFFSTNKALVVKTLGLQLASPESEFETQSQPDRIVGYEFQRSNDNGYEWLFRSVNEDNHQVVSVHCLDYQHWHIFRPQALQLIEEYVEFHQTKTSKHPLTFAFGLSYVDMFTWDAQEYPPLKSIFREDSPYLPRTYLERQHSWQNTSVLQSNPPEAAMREYFEKYSERIDIQLVYGDTNSQIFINHQVVMMLQKPDEVQSMLGNTIFEQGLKWAHSNNKQLLLKTLTEEVCKKIHLS